MEVSPMNKTAILYFILDEIILKARNVSRNMRKRIHWMLEGKEIVVREYDERALVLNGRVKLGKEDVEVSEVEEMKKGVSNYKVKNLDQLKRLKTLNNELRFFTLCFRLFDSIQVELVTRQLIFSNNYEICSKYSFNRAKILTLNELSTDQIKLILTRFKRIDRLEIHGSSLGNIDFSKYRIKQFYFEYVSFSESVYLPKEIDELHLITCQSPILIRPKRVNKINFIHYESDGKEYGELVKTLKGVKTVEISFSLNVYLSCLPSTVRKIRINELRHDSVNIEKVSKRFPYLIDFNVLLPIEGISETKLRAVTPAMSSIDEKFSFRPKRISVTRFNVNQLNNHPELFEKVESVVIDSSEFNFYVLPKEIKRIHIQNGKVNAESLTLNRFEKQFKQI